TLPRGCRRPRRCRRRPRTTGESPLARAAGTLNGRGDPPSDCAPDLSPLMANVVCVAAAILRRGDTVLVCRRRTTDSHPGKWEFPGGKIEPGESPADCVQREVAEELGVEATIGALVAQHR